jgi:hypothetical protein
VRWWINFVMGTALLGSMPMLGAGPQDFGMAVLNAAIEEHAFRIKPKIMAELDLNAPETFRIEPYSAGGAHITGGDLRGLMYGLLEAAAEMRATGKLTRTHGAPAMLLRGVRLTAETGAEWFASETFWRGFFETMARDRFNRLQLAFEGALKEQDFGVLRMIAETAAQDGVDLAVGLDAGPPALVARLLSRCPTVRTVVLNGADAVTQSRALLDVMADAGRRVVLEYRVGEVTSSLAGAINQAAIPSRRFAVYAGMGLNPQPPDFYWRMDGSEDAARLDAVSGAGFEIAVPRGAEGRPALEGIGAWGLRGYGAAK